MAATSRRKRNLLLDQNVILADDSNIGMNSDNSAYPGSHVGSTDDVYSAWLWGEAW